MIDGVTGIILAGGESRRMGRNKAFLPWGDTTLIEHVIERLRPVTDELIVAVRDARAFRRLKARVVEDGVPDAHALGGLYTGLRAARHERCFVCACDTPFVSPGLVSALIRLSAGYDVAIARSPRGLEPLHAVYVRSSTLPAIEEQFRQRVGDLRVLVSTLRVRIVEGTTLRRLDPTGACFVNLNTEADYAMAAAARLRRKRPSLSLRRVAGTSGLADDRHGTLWEGAVPCSLSL
jgi:molybdopterin-guanine dinucleotide biosynthesis protein A